MIASRVAVVVSAVALRLSVIAAVPPAELSSTRLAAAPAPRVKLAVVEFALALPMAIVMLRTVPVLVVRATISVPPMLKFRTRAAASFVAKYSVVFAPAEAVEMSVPPSKRAL